MLGRPEIRDLQLSDIYQRAGLQDCLQQLAPVNLSKKDIENLYFDRQHSGMRTLVAVADKYIIGTVTMIIEQKFIYNGSKVAHIEDLVVTEEYHGFGIGTMLVEAAVELAKIANCRKIILNCSKELEGWYTKLGFYKDVDTCMRLDVGV